MQNNKTFELANFSTFIEQPKSLKLFAMLQFLKIRNLALMDAVELEFDGGFNVVTGETGAGKSVLLGALAILAGNRVAKTVIRKGAESCEIEAVVALENPVPVDAVLEKLALPLCEDGQLILRRTIHVAKPGRISVNGALATLAQLSELGETWIDFHGPGEPQKLFHEKYQLEILDLFAGNVPALEKFSARFRDRKNLLAEIEAIRSQEKMSPDEIAFAQAQLDAMNRLDLADEAIEQLENDFAKIANAQELQSLLGGIDAALGDDGLANTFPQILRLAGEISAIVPAAENLASRANSLAIEAEDLRAEYAALLGETEADPETAAEISERMNSWLELRRKYGPDAANVRAKRDALALRIERQSDVAGTLARTQAQADVIEKELRLLAGTLHKSRLAAAKKLAAGTQNILVELGFKKADLAVRLTETKTLSETGTTDCAFLFSPNAGTDLLPLNKIASAGETARVMLALKAMLAEADATPVLVFDEVDANVGGEIAVHVARKLAEVARTHQVFCITHLAQVAALGKHHFCVTKTQDDTTTKIEIAQLDGDARSREDELARMLGDRRSPAALAHARELLASS